MKTITSEKKDILSAIADILHDIFDRDYYADKAIEYFFRNHRLTDDNVRQIIAEGVYHILREGGHFQAIAASDSVYDTGCAWYESTIEKKDFSDKIQSLSRQQRLSVTEWMDSFASAQLGDRYENIFASLQKAPRVYIRANTLLTTPSELVTLLEREGLEPTIVSNECVEISNIRGLFRTEAFKKGLCEVQDFASQYVAHFCDVEPGMRIIDGCAGAGGKSLHLAALMKNKGRVLCLDIYEEKLDQLLSRARRASVSIIETRRITSSKTIKRLDSSADRVLLDAPCSGSGVFRRNPDAKWRLDQEDMDNLIATQKDILRRYARMTKPDGLLIYVVCSIFPCEGEEQVHNFLSESNEQWECIEEKRFSPIDDYDGFYMAKLRRKSNTLPLTE